MNITDNGLYQLIAEKDVNVDNDFDVEQKLTICATLGDNTSWSHLLMILYRGKNEVGKFWADRKHPHTQWIFYMPIPRQN